MKDDFKVANISLKSRLIVGTGKYKNFKETAKAVKESGADMVTVAVRRINIIVNEFFPKYFNLFIGQNDFIFFSHMIYIDEFNICIIVSVCSFRKIRYISCNISRFLFVLVFVD